MASKRAPSDDDLRGTALKRSKTTGDVPVCVKRAQWPGWASIQDLVIFGDSYSSTPRSDELAAETESRNWVEHIAHSRRTSSGDVIEFHNFASAGDTAEDDLADQLKRFFAQFPAKVSQKSGPPLNPGKTLYVIWIGINDCGRTWEDDLEEIMEVVSDALHDLYVKAGARNFLLVDVPPMDRSPGGVDQQTELAGRCSTWNTLLRSQASSFADESKQASVVVFSAHRVLSDILDDPTEYEFGSDAPEEDGGEIWSDELHITSAVQGIIASRLESALKDMYISSPSEV
ncbi:carbohydrate esterase family 16 protein [Jaapia argillacea MUCL 33604]|uniref:Carbohydrate esterase family 16 protein n=1 Tax=Jaapia argillacea MUCL 33604 TaxID=933084 RepID=A0A067PMT7_9AGAM|nr:carbohydrate esterase family 16 protein [Jaapia argillacea MUCL 33604]